MTLIPPGLLGTGALMAGVYGAWNYIRMYLTKIYSLFFVRISIEEKELELAINLWAMTKTKASKLTIRNFNGTTDFVKPIGKNQYVAYETLSKEPTVYWYKRKPLIISGNNITFIRGTFNVNILIKDIVDNFNATKGDNKDENRFYIRKFHGTLQQNKNNVGYSDGVAGKSAPDVPSESSGGYFKHIQNTVDPVGWKRDDIGQIKKPEPMTNLALSEECLNAIEEIKRWRSSEQWYKDRQIPFKRGILLYGKPGNCKSSLAKALAMELNMPIMIFDLTNMSNNDFSENWNRVKNCTPCMVLLEDFDAIFDGRKNVVHSEGGLSFDCILNEIDGVSDASGILIVATTNDISKVDSAFGKPNGDGISTRPGRIDRALELLPPDRDGRIKIAKRILCDFPNEIDKVVSDGSNDSGAQFQERCTRLALRLFWTK